MGVGTTGGNPNLVQNIGHNKVITQWHFIYFGYSRDARKAYVYFQLKIGSQKIEYPNCHHYLAEKFYFALKDSRYPYFSG